MINLLHYHCQQDPNITQHQWKTISTQKIAPIHANIEVVQKE